MSTWLSLLAKTAPPTPAAARIWLVATFPTKTVGGINPLTGEEKSLPIAILELKEQIAPPK